PRTIGTDWLVTAGLKPGDRVVVEGGMMLRPGMPVNAVPFRESAPTGGRGTPAGPAAQAK
ncbi:MAG TPA: efflux transporter periplasmic adaptor subunit, partial [Sphingomonas sp.]